MDYFRKFATKHLGIISIVLDEVINYNNGYVNHYVL